MNWHPKFPEATCWRGRNHPQEFADQSAPMPETIGVIFDKSVVVVRAYLRGLYVVNKDDSSSYGS